MKTIQTIGRSFSDANQYYDNPAYKYISHDIVLGMFVITWEIV